MTAPKFRSFSALFAATFLCLIVLDFGAGSPGRVDEPLTAGLWAALLGHFLIWLLSCAAWGRVALGSLGVRSENAGLGLSVGSLLFALLMCLLGFAGLLLPGLRFFLFILEALGLALSPPRSFWKTPLKKEALAWLPLLVMFGLAALAALPVSAYWDPLHHHLSGARLFWETGRFYFPREAVASYQEGGFELLFLWPHFFFAKPGGLGLLPVQIFSQLTHAVLGFGGSLLLAHALASRWLAHPAWRALAVCLFAAPVSFRLAIPTAKNDWGLTLWLLGGFLLLCEPKRAGHLFRTLLATTGFIWGFAFLAKLSSGFAIAGLASVAVYKKLGPKEMLYIAAGFVAGMVPLALRNWLGAGNPLFPLFLPLFPATPIGPTWREALGAYQATPVPLARIRELTAEFPLAPVALLAPIAAWVRKNPPELRALATAFSVGFVLFALAAGKATELRLLGALLPVAGLLAAVITFQLVARIPFKAARLPWLLLALAAALLPYRWQALPQLQTLPHTHLVPRSYVTGEAQGWIRDHYRPGMKAGLLAESRFYHSLPLPVIRIWDSPALDQKLRAATTAEAFVSTLREEGFTHLIVSQEKLDLFYPKELVGMVEAYVLAHEQCLVFQSPYSVVADLSKLK